MSTAAAASTDAPREKPLGRSARTLLMLSAALAIALFYLYASLALVALLLLLGLEFVCILILARAGATGLVSPILERHGRLLGLLAGSFWRRRSPPFRIELGALDAPELFAMLDRLATRLTIPPPRKVLLEMNAGAWVHLRGFNRQYRTELGIGYDLLAGLDRAECEAVLAHELTHARLTRRTLHLWLATGLGHAAEYTNRLSALVDIYRLQQKKFHIGESLLAVADPCTRLAARLVAGYSRQDEFDADAGAAALCGASPMRAALLKLERIDEITQRISWQERMAHLQSPGGLSAWLTHTLKAAPAARSSSDRAPNPYASHPSIADRIAALGDAAGETNTDLPPALTVLRDADGIATRLVGEIHRLIGIDEDRDSAILKKWLRKQQRRRERTLLRILAGGMAIIGGLCAYYSIADEFDLIGLVSGVAVLVVAVGAFVKIHAFKSAHIPVPSFENLEAARRQEPSAAALEARETELKAEQTKATAGQSRKAGQAQLIARSLGALQECDYLRAIVAARAALADGAKSTEAQFAMAIGKAALRDYSGASGFIQPAIKSTLLRSPGAQWGAAWTFLLAHQYAEAESLLEEALIAWPEQTDLHAMLALCQRHRHKYHAAIAHAQLALSAVPASPDRLKLLGELLLEAGDIRECERLLEKAGERVRTDADLATLALRLHLHRENRAEADRWLEILTTIGLTPVRRLGLAVAFEMARRDDSAQEFYTAVLAEGFFPAAHLGLARLARRKSVPALARQHLLAALDTTAPLAKDAATPLAVFMIAVGQLNEMRESVSGAKAWIGTFTPDKQNGPLARQSVQVFATDQVAAQTYVEEVANALRPKEAPVPMTNVRWSLAPRDQQPVGAVKPGIQRVWET